MTTQQLPARLRGPRTGRRASVITLAGRRARGASDPLLDGPDGAALAEHLAWLRLAGRSAETVYQRHRNLIRLAARLPVPLLQADDGMLLDWRAGLGVGDATVAAYVSHVRGFYDWAAARGLIAASPAEGLPVPRLGRRLPRPVAETQLLDALQFAPARIRLMLVLAAWAGLRAKEIALLRRECVLDHAAVPVLLVAHDATKGRCERTVPLSPFVLSELHAAGMPARGWMFPRLDGRGGSTTPNMVSKLCNDWLHACGTTATLHQLRHRFGTRAYQAGRDLRAVQELLGHADPASAAGYAAYDNASAIQAVTGVPVPPWWQPPGTAAPSV